MLAVETKLTGWDALYQDDRFRTRYPAEPVVRFLASLPSPPARPVAVDVGCGAGRHTELLAACGYTAYPCDSSRAALRLTAERLADNARVAPAVQTSAGDLPFHDDTFDVGIAYGVFYYGSRQKGDDGVAELSRVLKPGGRAFVCVRSDRDWRARHLRYGKVDLHGEPEHEMPMHFLGERDLEQVYGFWFNKVVYERQEWSEHARKRLNSDWLITLTK